MGFSTILPQIKAVLEGVSGIQNVYDYPRYSSDITVMKSLAVSNSIFHLWLIERVAAPSVASLDNQVFRRHQFHLTGFYQVDDSAASEKTFQGLLDLVMNAFDNSDNLTLGDTCDQTQAAQLLEKSDVMFMDVLCHMGVILIEADEEVTVNL